MADQDQSRYSVEVFSVVSDQRDRMPYGAGRYPQIVSWDIALRVQTTFHAGIFLAKLEIVRNDDSRLQSLLQVGNTFGGPLSLDGPGI